ncbi:hypothetical protein KC19_VG141600 [Ceratodon purpureus]|uniref:Uncharacterized protein n=1 Tax=Ceratodon purpureus TaxID=3225 RepID=A0A8T0HPY4_CERPU|nr:hypothetical protein KC19_VG141600 [Ceratodon purpureus]
MRDCSRKSVGSGHRSGVSCQRRRNCCGLLHLFRSDTMRGADEAGVDAAI